MDLQFSSFLSTFFQNVSCKHALVGYADDYKIVAKNGITLQIDAHKIWRWCSSDLMSLNLNKCKVLCLKGIEELTIQGHQLDNSIVEKDLGIMISNDLTWTAQTEKRCEKTMKAFFTIKRNIANGTPWTTRKNLTVATSLRRGFATGCQNLRSTYMLLWPKCRRLWYSWARLQEERRTVCPTCFFQ